MQRLTSCRWYFVLLLLPFLALKGEEIRHGDKKESNNPPTEKKAEACILVETMVRKDETSDTKGFPIFWSSEMVGLDLARAFTAGEDPVDIPYSIETYYDGPLASLPPERLASDLRPKAPTSYDNSTDPLNQLLLSPSPVGTSAKGFLQFRLNPAATIHKVKHPPSRLQISNYFSSSDLDYLETLGPPPLLLLPGNQFHSEQEKPRWKQILFAEKISWEGLLEGADKFEKGMKAVLVPNFAYLNFKPEAFNANYTNQAATYLAASGLTNALSLFPELSNEDVSEWAVLTGNPGTLGTAASGLRLLNAYKLARVAARLRDQCKKDEDKTKCSREILADEKKRAAILNFTEEAQEKYVFASDSMRRPGAKCSERQKAFRQLREAMFLVPEKQEYREAVARILEKEDYSRAASFLRRGSDISDYTRAMARWLSLTKPNEQLTIRDALRKAKVDLTIPITRALETDRPDVRFGAVMATSVLEDAQAIEILKGLVRKQDWFPLRALYPTLKSEMEGAPRPLAKFKHYIFLTKAILDELNRSKEESRTSLSEFFNVLVTLFDGGGLTAEEKRHLVDYLSDLSLKGQTASLREEAVRALGSLWVWNQRPYVNRALAKLLRFSDDNKVISTSAETLGREVTDRRWILGILMDREDKIKGLSPLVENLRKEGWGK